MLLEVEGDTLYASQRPNSLQPVLTSVGIKSSVLKHRPHPQVREGSPEVGRGATEDFKRVLELDPRSLLPLLIHPLPLLLPLLLLPVLLLLLTSRSQENGRPEDDPAAAHRQAA